MPKFRVIIDYYSEYMEVEAETGSEAEEIAINTLDRDPDFEVVETTQID